MPPIFTEPGWNLHTPAADRHRQLPGQPLADALPDDAAAPGCGRIIKGGFYHDGRFGTLLAVVKHYNSFFHLHLTRTQMNDLVQYLRSI